MTSLNVIGDVSATEIQTQRFEIELCRLPVTSVVDETRAPAAANQRELGWQTVGLPIHRH